MAGFSGFKQNNTVPLYPSDLTLDQIRSKANGLHFAKEMLSDGEREILSLLESTLRLLDSGATITDFEKVTR